FTVSTQLIPYQRVQILGTAGRVEIEIPFNAPRDRSCRLWHTTIPGMSEGPAFSTTPLKTEEIKLPTCDHYALQGDAFSRAILDDTAVPTPIEDAVANMRVVEAVLRSAGSGKWEKP